MNYRYRATKRFWRNFYALPSAQKESARNAWKIFRNDPFDSRLNTHKVHRLSGIMKKTVHAVVIEGDSVVSFNVGTHAVYSE